MDKKRILVTGGAGFIGSNTCESLLNDGHQVVCLDNFITGRRENLDDFASNENFRLIVGDIRNLNDQMINNQLKLIEQNEKLKELSAEVLEENKIVKQLLIELLKENQKLKAKNKLFEKSN